MAPALPLALLFLTASLPGLQASAFTPKYDSTTSSVEESTHSTRYVHVHFIGCYSRVIIESNLNLLSRIPENFTATVYVPLHSTLQLNASHSNVTNNYTAIWWKSRLWNQNKGDRLGISGNCSLHPHVSDRILSCNDTLILTNMTYLDAGHYRLRQRVNKSSSVWSIFQVSVFDSQPVLSIIGLKRLVISIQCFDLRNPLAAMSLETKAVPGHPRHLPEITHTLSNAWELKVPGLWKGKYVIERNRWYMEADARCCASYHGYQRCGEWARISHNMYLDTASARGRPWCSWRGGNALEGVNFNHFHEGPLKDPTCHQTYFLSSTHHMAVCENFSAKVIFWKNLQGLSFKYQRPWGGKRVVAVGEKYEFRAKLNDTGSYFVVHNGVTIQNFTVTVLPSLKAAIRLIELKKHYLLLECTHNGRGHAQIHWEVVGTYSSYHHQGKTRLLVHSDCWENSDYWYFKYGVRCRVDDGPFQVYSRWFLGEARRTNFFICLDTPPDGGLPNGCHF